MDSSSILLVGIKKNVIAFNKATGERLWSTQLNATFGDTFVSIIADRTQAYVHAKGELYCLDLFTGAIRWKDELQGLGFGLVTMALPDGPVTSAAVIREKQRQAESSQSSQPPAT
ncbi:MAG: PQQ-binding-like beta-propeller repeat protein [Verrucomicrobia bacterium]|nr:PQQ-binding-like beta-propeller repeat protein [Verrucomicrobiota bacterium]